MIQPIIDYFAFEDLGLVPVWQWAKPLRSLAVFSFYVWLFYKVPFVQSTICFVAHAHRSYRTAHRSPLTTPLTVHTAPLTTAPLTTAHRQDAVGELVHHAGVGGRPLHMQPGSATNVAG